MGYDLVRCLLNVEMMAFVTFLTSCLPTRRLPEALRIGLFIPVCGWRLGTVTGILVQTFPQFSDGLIQLRYGLV